MAAKKGGLGKGIDSLISNKVNTNQLNRGVTGEKEKKTEEKVKISLVEPNREQPRRHFDEDGLAELAESIKQHGIIQPILVQDKKTYYEIIAGERRWRAAKLAGLKEVPVIIKDLSEQERMEIALIENIQREDLNPIDEALAYKRLFEEFHLKQEDVARRVAKSRTAVANSMRLLKLSEAVQQMVIDGRLSSGHARCLIPIDDVEKELQLANEIIEKNLSVRETERLTKNIDKKPKKKEEPSQEEKVLAVIYEDLEEKMKTALGTKVNICPKSKDKGKIEIEYYSQDDLDRILQLIQSLQSE